jgi:hypothetical protein
MPAPVDCRVGLIARPLAADADEALARWEHAIRG